MEPGTYTWKHTVRDTLAVRAIFAPFHKIDVDLWWNNTKQEPDIRLWVPLHSSSVEFGDLTGNGFGGRLHRKGLGTFTVNLAIQLLQQLYPSETPVKGILSNPPEDRLPDIERNLLEESRRIFWKRFGLEVLPQNAQGYECILGSVGKLAPIKHGAIDNQFPRYLPFDQLAYESVLPAS